MKVDFMLMFEKILSSSCTDTQSIPPYFEKREQPFFIFLSFLVAFVFLNSLAVRKHFVNFLRADCFFNAVEPFGRVVHSKLLIKFSYFKKLFFISYFVRAFLLLWLYCRDKNTAQRFSLLPG